MENQPEMLAALKRIEAIAHYHSRIAGIPDDLKDAFNAITEEASEAIALTK